MMGVQEALLEMTANDATFREKFPEVIRESGREQNRREEVSGVSLPMLYRK